MDQQPFDRQRRGWLTHGSSCPRRRCGRHPTHGSGLVLHLGWLARREFRAPASIFVRGGTFFG
jgi:hypothetical protein